MLRKYITYAKQTCRPKLQNADYDKIATVRDFETYMYQTYTCQSNAAEVMWKPMWLRSKGLQLLCRLIRDAAT